MIYNIIAFIITITFVFYLVYKFVKKSETVFEKLSASLLYAIIIISWLLYYLDYANIPSLIGWTKNINTSDWINAIFIILGSLISGAFLFIITWWQVKSNNKENKRRDKEDNRIKNMPLLTYKIVDAKEYNGKYEERTIIAKEEGKNFLKFVLVIKNIGYAPVRSMKIKLTGEEINNNNIIPSNNGVLSTNEEIAILVATNIKSGNFIWNIKNEYYDILNNKYKQSINLFINALNIFDNRGRKFIYKYKVENEKYINTSKK